jgi:hypothetical protein
MKSDVFWDVMLRGSCKNRRFGGTYRLHNFFATCRRITLKYYRDMTIHEFVTCIYIVTCLTKGNDRIQDTAGNNWNLFTTVSRIRLRQSWNNRFHGYARQQQQWEGRVFLLGQPDILKGRQ